MNLLVRLNPWKVAMVENLLPFNKLFDHFKVTFFSLVDQLLLMLLIIPQSASNKIYYF